MGAGVFAMAGVAAKHAGPSLCLSYLISGIMAMFTSMMYAELSSRIPINGSAFSYTYVKFGELPAWIIGWSMDIKSTLTAGALARGVESYLTGLIKKFGADVPKWMAGVSVFGIEDCSIVCLIFICLLTFIYTRGTSESKIFNTILTSLKITTLLMINLIGLSQFKISRFEPFLLEERDGLKGTLNGATIVYFGFIGFDFITVLYPQAKKPAQNVPFAVKCSTGCALAIYMVTAISLTGLARLQDFTPETAIADAFEAKGFSFVSYIIYFSALFGITVGCFTLIMATPQLLQV